MDPLSKTLPLPASAAPLTGSYHDFGGLSKLKGQARTDAKAATREAAQQFEALFLQMMLKSMRDASIKSDLNESSGKDTFEAMFDKEISLAMAKRNTLGLADLLVKHMPDTAASGNNPAGTPATADLLKARGAMTLQAAPASAHSLQPASQLLAPLPRSGAPMSLKGLRHE
jgi:Rod binding domain-containing protein